MFEGITASTLLDRDPRLEDVMCSLDSVGKMPHALSGEIREAVAMARRFNETVARPYALELDRKMQEDPTYLPWDLVREANRWGFYSGWIPKIFGGKGWNLGTMIPVVEELCSECAGIANLIGVQYFGISILFAGWNVRIIDKICREVVEGERNGEPCLVSGLVTEPGAGTDAEEVELLSKANVKCLARKVDGGYVVNGTKVFISNGHVSTWHMLIAYEDLSRPEETMILFAVKNGMQGFSFGRMEKKMGQKGCPASEMVFEDCFIPDENVCMSTEQMKGMRRSAKETGMQLIDFVVSLTRPGVGAMGAGVARGAFQEALAFARETVVDGKLLVDHEWAQCLLAQMYANVALARLTYMECSHVTGLYGMASLLNIRPLYYYLRATPTSMLDRIMPAVNKLDATTKTYRKLIMDMQKDEDAMRASGWASLSKFAATDLGIKNCHLAVEFMGQAGIRQDRRAEKILRDAKLLQIYEGTNQLNRLNLFKCLIGRCAPEARLFEE
ncbi:MAG: acyl-CoA dehydrogenase [Actinobacteria bacterium]|jgi:alkylation response protein AidB-like acyl-CoA dehydrogenase|nr:MAG: acyl-CoA dehydrogenase [Actinomycetota bacterium]